MEILVDHIYENSTEYHRAGMGDWKDNSHEKWLDCENKLQEMVEKDYSETDKEKLLFELLDISLSAKTIEK